MKLFKLKSFFHLAGLMLVFSSCEDQLDQKPTVDISSATYWKTEADATTALNGLCSDVRYLFDRDYYLDGLGEFARVRGNSFMNTYGRTGRAYMGNWEIRPIGCLAGFDRMYEFCFGAVNRANYVIDNVEKMVGETTLPEKKKSLEAVIGEAKLLRGLVYFRLISMWGDVPYINWRVYENVEVSSLPRTPIETIKDSIISDLTYAYNKLPVKASAIGRLAKPAALALRGKVQLYWGCWNKNGWPELDTFTPDPLKAKSAFIAAAADFKSVIEDYSLTLFRNGEPGSCDVLGKAEILPNYFYLFLPTANGDPEFILAFNHGGTGSGQSEELMRDLSGRSVETGQAWVTPRFEIADRYQSTITGEFCDPLIPLDVATVNDARTRVNSAVNPQSYANRDYRMKSTILWDYEMCKGSTGKVDVGWVPYIYKTWGSRVTINGVNYTSFNTDGTNSGYVFRKFVRNYAGQGRSDGDFNWPVIRLADVYLMYAEADNEENGPQSLAITLVNNIRHRGNLPALAAGKTSDKNTFFAAIEQERIVELMGEGQRSFDLRRWRAIERVWGQPLGAGKASYDTYGAQVAKFFENTNELAYQQSYIFKIPQSERDRNPNLTQNKPYR
ncbi:MAG: RagB/SusD family nutrient uptake outer membrane protein [Bacteroidales bacterium]|nr:RagB/SusD family nutrient uptake outer membrane protein [Bacteroidales bacterium]